MSAKLQHQERNVGACTQKRDIFGHLLMSALHYNAFISVFMPLRWNEKGKTSQKSAGQQVQTEMCLGE